MFTVESIIAIPRNRRVGIEQNSVYNSFCKIQYINTRTIFHIPTYEHSVSMSSFHHSPSTSFSLLLGYSTVYWTTTCRLELAGRSMVQVTWLLVVRRGLGGGAPARGLAITGSCKVTWEGRETKKKCRLGYILQICSTVLHQAKGSMIHRKFCEKHTLDGSFWWTNFRWVLIYSEILW